MRNLSRILSAGDASKTFVDSFLSVFLHEFYEGRNSRRIV